MKKLLYRIERRGWNLSFGKIRNQGNCRCFTDLSRMMLLGDLACTLPTTGRFYPSFPFLGERLRLVQREPGVYHKPAALADCWTPISRGPPNACWGPPSERVSYRTGQPAWLVSIFNHQIGLRNPCFSLVQKHFLLAWEVYCFSFLCSDIFPQNPSNQNITCLFLPFLICNPLVTICICFSFFCILKETFWWLLY